MRSNETKNNNDKDHLIDFVIDDKYQILELIGKGGFGLVYKAKHLAMDRIVAIKLLKENLTADKLSRLRFEKEAKTFSQLNHPNIISVFDYGLLPSGQPYLVMDYLDGISLDQVIATEGHLEEKRAVNIFTQICDAMSFAHEKGLIHRDLKPGNIMLMSMPENPEFVKLFDFGVAKPLEILGGNEPRLTLEGEVCGSPVYMSPEQCFGKGADARSDIYAMGCIMYETLAGKPPHEAPTVLETMTQQAYLAAKPFHEFNPEVTVSPALEAVILKSLEKHPEYRQQTMRDLKQELLDALEGKSPLILAPNDTIAKLTKITSADFNTEQPKSTLFNREASIQDPSPVPVLLYVLAALLICSTAIVFIFFSTSNKHFEGNQSFANNHFANHETSSRAMLMQEANLDQLLDMTLTILPSDLAKKNKAEISEIANRLYEMAKLTNANGDEKQTEKLLKKAVQITQSESPNITALNLNANYKLAEFYLQTKQFDRAEAIYADIVNRLRTRDALPTNSLVEASTHLAFVYMLQGKFILAKPLLNEVYNSYLKGLLPSTSATIVALNLLGQIYTFENNLTSANACFREAEGLSLKLTGKANSYTARALNGMAEVAYIQSNFNQALSLSKQALSIYQATSKLRSAQAAETITILANCLTMQQKYDQAEPLYEEVLSIRKELFPTNQVAIGRSLQDLASLYCLEKKYKQAEPLFLAGLQIDAKSFGFKSLEVADDLSTIGKTCELQGKYLQAEDYYQKALSIRKSYLDGKHPDLAKSYSNLARLYFLTGNTKIAEGHIRQAMIINESYYGNNHPSSARILNTYADIMLARSHVIEAFKAKLKAWQIEFAKKKTPGQIKT